MAIICEIKIIDLCYTPMNQALAATQIQSSNVSINTNSLDAVLSASPIVQLTLLILVVLSVFCWAVGYAKYRQFKNLGLANDIFLNRFFKAKSLEELFASIETFKESSHARIFKAGYIELQRIAEGNRPSLFDNIDNLERTLRKATDIEISFVESNLTLLATTGSTGPFIGLFGTVWGIMGSFHKIGVSGNASLAVVAPGISEALIATAIGLAAAIPAVVMYNNFIAKIKKLEMSINNFNSDFINIVRRSSSGSSDNKLNQF